MKTRTHNGSRLLSLLLAVVLVFTLTVPALAADKPQDMNLRIAVMSDLHYLSPDMIAGTEDFEHALNSDRKLLKESSAILHEKFEQVRADKPDILLVSGDLTKDGEQECHAALAKQLQQLQQMPAMLHAVRLDITRYELLDGALRSEGYAARQVLDLG